MQVAVFSTKPYDRDFLRRANAGHGHDITFLEPRLSPETASLAEGFEAVCVFVNGVVDREVLTKLAAWDTRLVALRSAGFNNVDLEAAQEVDITVARVPVYSPHAVAEHGAALILALNRKIHRAYARVREGNFSLAGLMGFDLVGRTVGIVGTGTIGTVFARIRSGFGCRLLANDPLPNRECRALGVEYVGADRLFSESDIVAVHAPLTPDSYHLVDERALARMKRGAMLINTSRGALVDTRAVIRALKDGTLGALGIDVYEEEADLFFEDLSQEVIRDDVFARLLTFPNVLVTAHQAFFTEEAVGRIAETTLQNISSFEQGNGVVHPVTADKLA